MNLRHNRVLHDTVLLLAVETSDAWAVDPAERAATTLIGPGIWKVVLTFGFMDDPDVPAALARLEAAGGPAVDPTTVTYFLGRETVVATPSRTMDPLRERLFVLQNRTAASAARFFGLPSNQVFEVGTTIEV